MFEAILGDNAYEPPRVLIKMFEDIACFEMVKLLKVCCLIAISLGFLFLACELSLYN